MKKYKIVCIDDEKDILELFPGMFENSQYETVLFDNGDEALSYIYENKNSIVFILSDYKLSEETTGLDVRERMLDKGIDLPFAIFTAFYNAQMAKKGMNLKVLDFLKKPLESQEIVELVTEHANILIEQLNEEKEMIQDFIGETKPMLEEIQDLILALEEDPEDTLAIDTYFRLLHTIKGTSSCLGLDKIASFSHEYEDLIVSVKNNNLVVNTGVINAFLKGIDYLNQIVDCYENERDFPFEISEIGKIFKGPFEDDEVKETEDQAKSETKEAAVKSPLQDASEKDEKLTVPLSVLNEFMEYSGELTVIRNTILKSLIKLQQEIPGNREVEILSESLGEMHKVSSILQNQISELKKVTMESVYRPMKRVVRDSCKSTKKNVEFETAGGDLRVDTTVGKVLNKVLVHLIRNGVDHGIESSAERIKLGKKEVGQLLLRSFELGEEIIVELIDDGKGIDPNIIRAKALEKGLYTQEELDQMSDIRALQIIFQPGFSTAQAVTNISGRGVGMDMVKSTIEEMGGRIFIESIVGEGSKFKVVLPIPRSVLIIKSLMVGLNDKHFSIALDEVAEVVLYEENKEDSLHQVEGKLILEHHSELIPLIDLSDVLEMGERERDSYNIVILKTDGMKYGILVDDIYDIEEIVVKSIKMNEKQKECYSGVTFIGDGEIALILNTEGIAKKYDIEIKDKTDEELENYATSSTTPEYDHSQYMRFNFFKSLNYALPLQSVHRLEEIKCSDIQYYGKKKIVRYRGKSMPIYFPESCLAVDGPNEDDLLKELSVLSVLVISKNNGFIGFVVKEVIDIGISNEAVSTVVANQGLLGTLFFEEGAFSILDVQSIISETERQLLGPADEIDDVSIAQVA